MPLAGAWLLPLLTHLLRMDVLLLPVIVVGVASLLRIGSSLVDRLVAAFMLTVGLAMAAGLLFSSWPWGPAPVPVGGVSLSALVLVAAATGRAPRLPRRMLASDMLVLGSGLAATLVAAWPGLGGGLESRITYAALTDDRMRHFNLFDTIQHVGGYVFLHSDAAQPIVEQAMGKAYPNGMHFVYALTDSFVRSGRGVGDSFGELDRYYWYVVAAYGLFVLAVVWAARWVAGPTLAGWRRALVCSAIGAFLATGMMTTLLSYTSDAEVLGLALLAALTAFLIRPPVRVGDHALVVAALVTAVSFTYTLFLVFALAGVLVSSVVYRRRLLRDWPTMAMTAAISVPIALIPLLWPRLNGFDAASHFLKGGYDHVPVSRRLLVALAGLALLSPFASSTVRRPRLRALTGMALLSVLAILAITAYVHLRHGQSAPYYSEKLMHGLLVVLLLAAAPAAYRLRASARNRRPVLTAVAATVAGVLMVGGVSFGKTVFHYGPVKEGGMRPGADTTWASVWMGGQYFYAGDAPALFALRRAGLVPGGTPTLVIFDKYGLMNTHLSLVLATFNRDVGVIGKQVDGLTSAGDLMDLPAQADAPMPPAAAAGWENLKEVLGGIEVRTRVVVSDAGLAARLRLFSAAHPQPGLEIIELPTLPRMRAPA